MGNKRASIGAAGNGRRRMLRGSADVVGSRQLVLFGVIALFFVAAGLLMTVRNVGSFVDATYAELQRRQVESAIGELIETNPSLSRRAAALKVARLLSLQDARIGSPDAAEGPVIDVEIGRDEIGRPVNLSWTPPSPGLETLRHFAPTRLPFILGAVLAAGFLLLRLHRLTGALERERRHAENLAETDHLTGLGSRRAFERDLALRIGRGERFALFYLDLDGFKGVNDRFGHSAGDALLSRIGARLARYAGPGDGVFRLGGDEFIVLADGTDAQRNLERLARKFIMAIEGDYPVAADAYAPIGVSVGIAFSPEHSVDAEDLLSLADAALYEAKRQQGSALVVADRPNGAAWTRKVA